MKLVCRCCILREILLVYLFVLFNILFECIYHFFRGYIEKLSQATGEWDRIVINMFLKLLFVQSA